jgi:hypothetical protein
MVDGGREPSESATSAPPPGAEPTEITGGSRPYALGPATPLDTDDTRGLHFRALLRHPWLLGLAATIAIAAFIVGTSAAGMGIGLAAAAAVVILTVAIAFLVASSRAKEDFFEAYATGRGLNRVGKGLLPPATPLLRKGDRRYGEQIMNGTLPGGLPGALALYTYEVDSTDSDGDRDTDYYRFTVVMHDLPTVAPHLADLYCERRSGFRWMDSAEDVFRRMKRLELESVALDKRYEIFYGANDSENWLHQLFSPSFIVWLAEHAPRTFAFELSGGSLCISIKGHHDNATEFDELCEAAAVVARRLTEEAGESEPAAR